MTLQHVNGTAVLPEALARFSHDETRSTADPLRPISLVAMCVDSLLISASMVIGFFARGTGAYPWRAAIPVLFVWVAVLAIRGAYDSNRIGVGSEEFKNVIAATVGTFAFFASVGFVMEITDGRKFVLGAFIAGVVLLPLGRRAMRIWVFRQRRAGRLMRRTLVIGSGSALDELAAGLSRDPRTGFEVVSAMAAPLNSSSIDAWLDQVSSALDEHDVDAVAITQTRNMPSEVVRRLSWRLEGPSIDLLVAPELGDVTGPRLRIRPAAGLPLMHLEEPRLTGPQALVKGATDVVTSSLGLVLLSPVMIIIGLVIRMTSSGPALFIQDRVGRAGEVYRLAKFRTMYEGSEQHRQGVLGSIAGDPEAYRNDPRITPFGRFLRRWSLDELPQLWNVLVGDMSLVGPRPMLVEELPLLGTSDHRRHLTKPGMTGLWQVAGRKDVEWSERMQMDLRYVENWSPTLDLVILAKTFKAVATGRGAH
ncbi:MAG TPA: sugar transferase [Actinomycetota bacterium]|nr:sugar transferase [Actinomycetota bacterium]